MRRYRSLLRILVLTILLAGATGAAFAVPIGDLSRETVARPITGGLNHQFGWTARYDIGFTAATGIFDVALNINLTGADPGDALRAIWERGIENAWSRRFSIMQDQQFVYDILFDVAFVQANSHHTVTVHNGTGAVNMLNWYTERPSGWPQDRQGLTAAHEAGHMFGNFDEYVGGGVNPDGSFGNVPDSLMGALLTGTLYDRHFQFVADWATGKDPSHAFAVVTSVPEPTSVILLLSGAAGLASAAWKRRQRR
jgi:PEP-CTERM motif